VLKTRFGDLAMHLQLLILKTYPGDLYHEGSVAYELSAHQNRRVYANSSHWFNQYVTKLCHTFTV